MKTATSRFEIKSWSEHPYHEAPNQPKLTRATVTKTYTGDIEGDGQVEYFMMYRADGTAAYVGLERVAGRIGANAGTCCSALASSGGGLATETYTVIPGSGTGALQGLTGEGRSTVGHGLAHPFTLSYDLP